MQISLLDLPTELMEHIASFLSQGNDILSLRLTCQATHARTLTAFGATFFHTIETDLSAVDIEDLKVLAERDHLCRHVKTLCITPKLRTPSVLIPFNTMSMRMERRSVFGHGFYWPRNSHGTLEGAIPIVNFLGTFLSTKCVNCISFRICNGETDFPGEECRTDYITSADSLAVLLHIISKFKIHVSTFDFNLGWSSGYVQLQSERVHPNLWDVGEFESTWAHSIRDLRLVYSLSSMDHFRLTARLISAAKSLRSLKCRFDGDMEHSALFRGIVSSGVSLPLQELVLFSADLSENSLVTFLSSVRSSIRSIVLCMVHLNQGSWRSVFEVLQTDFPLLENITLFHLYGPEKSRIFFCHLRHNRKLPGLNETFELRDKKAFEKIRIEAVRYQGRHVQVALDALARSVYHIHQDRRDPSPGYPGRDITHEPATNDFSVWEYRW